MTPPKKKLLPFFPKEFGVGGGRGGFMSRAHDAQLPRRLTLMIHKLC